ncbi:hypothetical protein OTU49_006021 [Cherax quadricarinatus]|uniref:Uncharacterized protein n=1 Tax=Cherax quadricarinatus TaxID=27406 RepID=A0AAW0X370_CHEQU
MMVESIWSGGWKGKVVMVLLVFCSTCVTLVHATVEEIQVSPTSVYGFQLGELSWMQFIMGSLIFIMFVVLYAEGVLPVEVDLGFPNTVAGQTRNPRADNRVGASIVFVDCPLQFVCEMETWANRDHDRFLDRLIASWFRSPNITWNRPEAATFAGMGICMEMYPCPFDVQEVVGFRIPGSNSLTSAPSSWTGISFRQEPWL